MPGWAIALVGAGGALAGSAITGGLQVWLQGRDHHHERLKRATEARASAYERYLVEVLSLPNLFAQMTREREGSATQDLMGRTAAFRAAMWLSASPEVQAKVEAISDEGLPAWFAEANRRVADEQTKPLEQREQLIWLYTSAFNQTVLPMLRATGELMAVELHPPTTKERRGACWPLEWS
jgi:hypothetical protein